MTTPFWNDTLKTHDLPRCPEELTISEHTSGMTRDQAVSNSLAAIHDRGDGLYNQVLVIINGVVNFDSTAGYCTQVTGAGSGGTDTFLDLGQYQRDSVEYNEARLSRRDSEVACLQDAWDWLTTGLAGTPHSVAVVVVGNIGPCVPCQRRIKALRDALVQRFGAGVQVEVEVIYDQDDASAWDTERSNIPTTYGYRDLPDSSLSDGTLVWKYQVT